MNDAEKLALYKQTAIRNDSLKLGGDQAVWLCTLAEIGLAVKARAMRPEPVARVEEPTP